MAIARALVNEPDVLLLDEPLGALDLKMRQGMQIELKNMQQALGITFIYVTHDQEEALTMSDTVVVMRDGRIQQVGTPIDIYNEPKNAFVADFIGESNIIGGTMIRDRAVWPAVLLNASTRVWREYAGGCGDPPEDIELVPESEGMLTGEVRSVIFKGVHYEMLVATDGYVWMVHDTLMQPTGSKVGLVFTPQDIHIMWKEEG